MGQKNFFLIAIFIMALIGFFYLRSNPPKGSPAVKPVAEGLPESALPEAAIKAPTAPNETRSHAPPEGSR
jgi:hypothetical protein